MAEYLSPAVYIEEKSSGIKPIQGLGTSTAAFVGHAEKGPIGEAVPINNFSEFQKKFGGYIDNGFLAFAVKAFFDEGGTTCYVVRTCHYNPPLNGGDKTPAAVASHKDFKRDDVPEDNSMKVTAHSPGSWGDDISIEIKHVPVEDDSDLRWFKLIVKFKGKDVETYDKLIIDNTEGDYVETKINGISQYIEVKVKDETSSLSAAQARPAETSNPVPLDKGDDGLSDPSSGASTLVSSDYTGDENLGSGLHAFDKIDGINIVAVPDAVDRSVHIGGMTYCENRGDCFYVADSQQAVTTADNVLNYKLAQGEYAGGNAINSKYGALYTPWISVFDPRTSGTIEIPPSGAAAGIYARTDGSRGVHKAPAGIVDGKFRTALDVEKNFTDADQAKLNPKGINVIRKMKNVGIVAWGTRTVSSDPEWRYLNIRRLFLFLEESIENATRWVVFEPNDKSLWKSIVRNVSAFLRIQWRKGALVGNTEEEAFYVKCDEETNPQESIDLGRVITEIGVAPSKPAEFVIFRIAQYQGGSEVSE